MQKILLILLCVMALKAFGANSGPSILNFLSLMEEKGLGLLTVVGLLIFVIFKTQKLEYIEKLLSNHITDTNKEIAQTNNRIDQQREDFNRQFDQQRAESNKKFDQQREDFNKQFEQQREESKANYAQMQHELNEVRKDIKQILEKIS